MKFREPVTHRTSQLLAIDLLGGRLRPALDAAAPFPDPPRMDGAEEAARAVLEEAGAGRRTTAP